MRGDYRQSLHGVYPKNTFQARRQGLSGRAGHLSTRLGPPEAGQINGKRSLMSMLSKFLHLDPFVPTFNKVQTSFWAGADPYDSKPDVSHLFTVEDYRFLSHVLGTQQIITIEN